LLKAESELSFIECDLFQSEAVHWL
jgi:hypothetical protein